jgi:hypothetical protein
MADSLHWGLLVGWSLQLPCQGGIGTHHLQSRHFCGMCFHLLLGGYQPVNYLPFVDLPGGAVLVLAGFVTVILVTGACEAWV